MSTQTQAKDQAKDQDQPTLVITERDKFWMNCKLYQLWRFIVLNIKILKAVDQSKRS